MSEPRTVPMNFRASPRFRDWFQKERARKGLTARELCELLALTYVVKRTKKEEVAPWPLD